jgi:hypothetical protein
MKNHKLEFQTKYDIGHKIYTLYGHRILTYTLDEIRVFHKILDESDKEFNKEVRVEYFYRVNTNSKSFEYDEYISFGHFKQDFDHEKYTEDPEELIQLLVEKVRDSLKETPEDE